MKVKCENVLADGRGVIFINNKKVFIPGILKGEEIDVIKKKRYELQSIITKSEDRIDVKCPSFYECGGCQYLHIDYKKEQEIKRKYCVNLFKDLYTKKSNFYFMNNPLNYRNKVCYTFKESKRHQLALGLYKDNSHDVITVSNCLLHDSEANKIANSVLKILSKYKLRAFDEKSNNGLLKHLLIRISSLNNEALVALVLNEKTLPKRKDIIKDILKEHSNVTSIIENYNLRDTSIVLGEENKVIYGPGFIYDSILGYKFKICADTFYQINHEAVEVLYEKAIKSLELTKNEILLDAYCGVGTIGIIASKFAKQVVGIEFNKTSVNNARLNAKINNVKNIDFICGDATDLINKFYLNKTKVDAIILDPPREGSTKQFIEAVAKLKIKKVCYVSCEPETLKRDLEIFKQFNYEIKTLDFVDMFPRTFNVECVCRLERKSK